MRRPPITRGSFAPTTNGEYSDLLRRVRVLPSCAFPQINAVANARFKQITATSSQRICTSIPIWILKKIPLAFFIKQIYSIKYNSNCQAPEEKVLPIPLRFFRVRFAIFLKPLEARIILYNPKQHLLLIILPEF